MKRHRANGLLITFLLLCPSSTLFAQGTAFTYQGRLDENGTIKFIIVNPPTGNRFYASSNHELESSIRDAEISELKQRLSDLEKLLRHSANPKK